MSGDDYNIKILFFGDIVGKPGRNALRDFLKNPSEFSGLGCDENYSDRFVIANVENASHGFGLTEKNYNDISGYGANCMTSGNHIWDKKEIFNYIEAADKLVRPIHYPSGTPGTGSRIFEFNGAKIAVINALGRVFLNPLESPWELVKNEIEKIKRVTPIIIVDFHAEATAEKICFAKFCSQLGCTAVFGTHTHVQTADETLLNGRTAYISDAGFCGATEGVIGMDFQTSLNRFLTGLPERYEIADSSVSQINAVEVEVEPKTGYAVAIRRILCSKEDKEKENSQ